MGKPPSHEFMWRINARGEIRFHSSVAQAKKARPTAGTHKPRKSYQTIRFWQITLFVNKSEAGARSTDTTSPRRANLIARVAQQLHDTVGTR